MKKERINTSIKILCSDTSDESSNCIASELAAYYSQSQN